MKFKNSLIRMMFDSDIIYVDGETIKDRFKEPTHPNLKSVLKNVENYFIISLNRDIKQGPRYLELRSKLPF